MCVAVFRQGTDLAGKGAVHPDRIELFQKGSRHILTLGSSRLQLDEESHIFSLDGEVISSTTMEWRIMSYLVANAVS